MKNVVTTFVILLCLSGSDFDKCSGQVSQGQPALSFWIVGSSEQTRERFGESFPSWMGKLNKNKEATDHILLVLAEKPLSKRDLFKKCNLPKGLFNEIISQLESSGLIGYKGRLIVTNIPVITDRQMKIIKDGMMPAAFEVARFMENEIPRLREFYQDQEATFKPSWETMAHLFIDNLIVDGTFRRAIDQIELDRGLRSIYSDKQQIITSFMLEQGKNFSTFGTNWYVFNDDRDKIREVYVLHGKILGRYKIPLNRYENDPDMAAFMQSLPENRNLSVLNEKEERILNELKWIKNDSLAIPLIDAGVIKAAMPLIEDIGKKSANEFFKHHSVVIDLFNNSPYADFLKGKGDYIQVCYHVLFSGILEQLLVDEELPPIPEPLPENFGVFITIGNVFKVMR